MAQAVFGGGCFWCLEAIFNRLKGVTKVTSGYAGGHVPNPTYEQVGSGRTGHAESVRIDYDPAIIGYRDLLEVFFQAHDPTTPDRQGVDIGPEYRSVILYADDAQKKVAEEFISELEALGRYAHPVVTEVKPLEAFYPAEEYHQDYYQRHPGQPYCRAVIEPKLAKLFKK
ncbi:peptide-methionine (S)-S-oxide reductase MsrA [Dehalogenimonas sp. THU2]|uniref:peptide-methionine (S)-S-oxide reductase MsrA n=1 Tax=Dehalogenimonas sp. THU2 TaxID=3151121 RepID=UPI003218231D